MSSQAISPVPWTVLGLLVTLGQCLGQTQWSGCDNGKVLLDTDLPKDTAHWTCPTPLWTQAQGLYGVDTVYDPEPATWTCMDQRIIYNLPIPNSGAFRPVSAESGEYLYCPPQRWINNLHRGATVLLYHPCSSLHERRLLSALARSCIDDYILTPHKNLDKNRPFALASWGRTLEVSTLVSSQICDWLNGTSSNKPEAAERRREKHYNLLLTRSEDQDQLRGKKGSLMQCCEQTISSQLEEMNKTQLHLNMKTELIDLSRDRVKRAAVRTTTDFPKVTNDQTSGVIHQLQSVASPNGDESGTKDALSPSTSLKENHIHKKFRSNTSRISNVSVIQTQAQIHSVDSNDKTDFNHKNKGTDKAAAKSKLNEVIDLKEREIEKMNNDVKSPQSESKGVDSASQTQADAPKSEDCQCKTNPECECDPGHRGQSAGLNFQRTPRTEEGVWAAGALGFLLVLLTLSILHTRLYRQCRRGTSLYWHDPQQDYDSVADVIHHRLRLSKRRRKRGRKKECVLLPSSSSSEEYP
ncbi:uncharacterized protein tp53i13 [Periophthalmus magnuspinnatus]|uniref:uncharacterized protein tp53i13 n=1 Tax=Periophthalmus magnuspinnatus TaxID=409849 RepID=UPI00145B7BC4|nr:uncharacterized protein tp53i13 [Periophthalmus magnuspinnatus]